MAATDLISTTTFVSLGFTVVLVVVAWLITESLRRTFHLKRPRIDYWIILWLTWDALIHFIVVSILKSTVEVRLLLMLKVNYVTLFAESHS